MDDVILSQRNLNDSRWSLFSWTPTSTAQGYGAEQTLLNRVLSFNLPFSITRPFAQLGLVKLDDQKSINTLVIGQHASKYIHLDSTNSKILDSNDTLSLNSNDTFNINQKKNLVMTHGYGAGLGFFYKNYQDLAKLDDYNIFSLDWLGMGNSSRPSFVKSGRHATDDIIVNDTENFFIDSLEAWRIKMGLESMVLLGHSMGGYLSTCYALKYPERVEKLILVSPVGVPSAPEPSSQPQRPGYLLSLFRSLWSWNVTPMSVIRTFGPAGPSLVKRYATHRFKHLDNEEAKDLENYIYHISAQPGSGEYALARLLLPGAWPRKPLHPRLPNLKMPTTFIYGDIDWMNHEYALKAVPDMKTPVKVVVVENAGHHLYLDNPDAFNQSVLNELDDFVHHPQVKYVYE
ncbi:Alpha/Beta hydrolase protein [Globomyces pollinis-pini]|nr:Alpha/Beta hydrolase protein [Globomyces pollinis-pini]